MLSDGVVVNDDVRAWLLDGVSTQLQTQEVPLSVLFRLFPEAEPKNDKWVRVMSLCERLNKQNLANSDLQFYSVLLHWFQEHGIHDDYRLLPPEGTVEHFLFTSILSRIKFFYGAVDEFQLPQRLDMMPWTFLIGSYAYMVSEWNIVPPHLAGLAEAYEACLDRYTRWIALPKLSW